MPGMNGWDLARAVRQSNEIVPIALITGWGETVSSSDQNKAKIDWVISKPFTAERISSLAAQIKTIRARGRETLPGSIVAA
jgi:DNA-binding response OmpR family regulator